MIRLMVMVHLDATDVGEEINNFISLAHEILRLQGLVIKEGWTKNKYYPGQATCKIENWNWNIKLYWKHTLNTKIKRKTNLSESNWK